jgi:transcriptional regulator with XRE-family HTH domain
MANEPVGTDPVRTRAVQLGAELRRRREGAGLTQIALGDRIRYHRSYVSQVESGDQVPAEQFILQAEKALNAGGQLHALFRELHQEREARRQETHTERWRAATGDRLRAAPVAPGPGRELRTLEFVSWVAEHSSLTFEEAYGAVVAEATQLEQQPPAVRYAAHHRRSRITREQLAQALVAYYELGIPPDSAAGFYRAQVGDVLLTLSVLTRENWLGSIVQLGSEEERFRFVTEGTLNGTGKLKGAALDAALRRLATVEVSGTVLTNGPLYRLLDVDIGPGRLDAAVTLAHFASYALTMDLLESELVSALAADDGGTGAAGKAARPLEGAGRLPLRGTYLPTADSAFAIDQRLCVGGPVALLAAARAGDARGDGDRDYVLLIQERSSRVLNATGRLAVVPKSFHEPTVEPGQEIRLSSSLERELEEELLGREDLEGSVAGFYRVADPFHADRISEPMRWLHERRGTDAYRVECTGFGLNMVSGNCEFPCLILIDDEEWWTRYGGQVEAAGRWSESGATLRATRPGSKP